MEVEKSREGRKEYERRIKAEGGKGKARRRGFEGKMRILI